MHLVLPSSPFDGVWKRESIALDGGAPFEDSNVYWLHAGDYFADMRWPKGDESIGGLSAFAGTTHWDPPKMRFDHELDLHETTAQDVGTLVFADNKLIESGEAVLPDKSVRFEEVWVRVSEPLASDCVARYVADESAGFIVRVGEFLAILEKKNDVLSAATWRREKDWVPLFSIHRTLELEYTLKQFVSGSLGSPWVVRRNLTSDQIG